jgi:hypothetical protein
MRMYVNRKEIGEPVQGSHLKVCSSEQRRESLRLSLVAPVQRAQGRQDSHLLPEARLPPYPPVFAYVGETKGLRANGLHQGETKELAVAKAKKKQRSGEKSSGKRFYEESPGRGRVCADSSQRRIAVNLSTIKQHLMDIIFEWGFARLRMRSVSIRRREAQAPRFQKFEGAGHTDAFSETIAASRGHLTLRVCCLPTRSQELL